MIMSIFQERNLESKELASGSPTKILEGQVFQTSAVHYSGSHREIASETIWQCYSQALRKKEFWRNILHTGSQALKNIGGLVS